MNIRMQNLPEDSSPENSAKPKEKDSKQTKEPSIYVVDSTECVTHLYTVSSEQVPSRSAKELEKLPAKTKAGAAQIDYQIIGTQSPAQNSETCQKNLDMEMMKTYLAELKKGLKDSGLPRDMKESKICKEFIESNLFKKLETLIQCELDSKAVKPKGKVADEKSTKKKDYERKDVKYTKKDSKENSKEKRNIQERLFSRKKGKTNEEKSYKDKPEDSDVKESTYDNKKECEVQNDQGGGAPNEKHAEKEQGLQDDQKTCQIENGGSRSPADETPGVQDNRKTCEVRFDSSIPQPTNNSESGPNAFDHQPTCGFHQQNQAWPHSPEQCHLKQSATESRSTQCRLAAAESHQEAQPTKSHSLHEHPCPNCSRCSRHAQPSFPQDIDHHHHHICPKKLHELKMAHQSCKLESQTMTRKDKRALEGKKVPARSSFSEIHPFDQYDAASICVQKIVYRPEEHLPGKSASFPQITPTCSQSSIASGKLRLIFPPSQQQSRCPAISKHHSPPQPIIKYPSRSESTCPAQENRHHAGWAQPVIAFQNFEDVEESIQSPSFPYFTIQVIPSSYSSENPVSRFPCVEAGKVCRTERNAHPFTAVIAPGKRKKKRRKRKKRKSNEEQPCNSSVFSAFRPSNRHATLKGTPAPIKWKGQTSANPNRSSRPWTSDSLPSLSSPEYSFEMDQVCHQGAIQQANPHMFASCNHRPTFSQSATSLSENASYLNSHDKRPQVEQSGRNRSRASAPSVRASKSSESFFNCSSISF